MNEKRDTFGTNTNIIIPDYKRLDASFSKWELIRGKELLVANGFGTGGEAWRKAAKHSEGLIRETALYFLTLQPEKVDEALFKEGLEDVDESVQAYAAFGLYKLGDASALETLKALAMQTVEAHVSAILAAGLLGKLGFTEGFATIQASAKSGLEYVQLFGVKNAFYFYSLHGKAVSSNQNIDIWQYYREVLSMGSSNIRVVAFAQLKEIGTETAQSIIKEHK